MRKTILLLLPLVSTILFWGTRLQAQYCTPYVFYTDDEDIENVTFNSINNTSVGLCNTYTDYTAMSTTVSAGGTYFFSVNTSDCEGANFYDRSVGIWIDFNIDDDFDDPGEMVYASAYTPQAPSVLFSGNITIPVSATAGTTRMRVTCVEDDIYYYGPCDSYYYGETEDYSVVIVTTPCTAPPTAGTATVSDSGPCSGEIFSLGISGGTIGIGQTYQWQSSPDNVTWTNIPGATNSGYSISITDTTWFRSIVTCSGQSDTTTVVVAELAAFYNCYCIPTTTYGCGSDYIDNVTFENINNTTGCTGMYNDYTSMYLVNLVQGTTYPLSVTTDGDSEGIGVWIDYDHSGTFDPSEQILTGYTGNQPETYTTNVTIPLTAMTGNTRMRVRCKYSGIVNPNEGCGNFTYGETEDYMLMISAPPDDDGGLMSLISPSLPPLYGCTVNDTIRVVFNTIGNNPLTSLDFNYSVNGGAPVTVSWSGNLAQYQSDTMMIGVTTMNDGDMLQVWVSNPNGVPDGYTLNDSISLTLYDGMSGTYTIGGTAPDFMTLADARDALEQRGVCGPVIMNIRSGAYTEQVSIGTIPGTSAVNTVTFQSEAMDASQVTIDYAPGSNADNFVVRFDGSSYVTFNELTMTNSTSYYAHVVEFVGNATHNTVQNCVLVGDTVSTSTTSDRAKVVVWSGTDQNDYSTIRNNVIRGGEWAISMWGTSGAASESGLVIDSNYITDYYQAGMVLVYQSGAKVRWNRVESDTNNFITNIFHIDIEESFNGATIVGNHVSGRQGGFGINLFQLEAQPGQNSLVANNFVYMGATTPTTYCEGIAVQDCSNSDIIFNSVHNRSLAPASAGIQLFMGNSSGIRIANNNIVHSGAGYAINCENGNYIDMAGNNNLYTDSTNFVKIGATDYADLQALQSAVSMYMNSLSVDPMFAGEDLHTCRQELDNAGMMWPGVVNDFDMDSRNAGTPDIGADEFVTSTNFTLGPDILKCPNDSVLLGAEVINSNNYDWGPYFQTTPTIYATTPNTYIVQIASACGTAVDTILVANYPVATASFTTTTSFFTVITNNTSTNGTSYFWDFGDGNTSTDFEPAHAYGGNGTYMITLTAISDCGDTVTFSQSVVINPNTGIEENGFADLSVYPNPSDGYFTVSLTPEGNEDVLITIQDLSGRMLYEQRFGSSGEVFTVPVDIRGAAAGTYVLRLQSGDHSGIRKIIVN